MIFPDHQGSHPRVYSAALHAAGTYQLNGGSQGVGVLKIRVGDLRDSLKLLEEYFGSITLADLMEQENGADYYII